MNDGMQRSLESLGNSMAPLRDPGPRSRQQERIVGAINRQAARIQERRRVRRYWQVGLAAAALVVTLVVVVGVVLPGSGSGQDDALVAVSQPVSPAARVTELEGSGTIRSGAGDAAATERASVAWGDHVLVPAGSRLRLEMPERAAVVLSQSTEIEFTSAGDGGQSRLALRAGRGEFSVRPLPAGNTFVVVTPSAEVVVHGTRFAVQVGGDGASVTVVTVFEGEVGVISSGREVLLHPGDQWSSEPPAASASTSADTETAQTESGALPTPSAKSHPRPTAAPSDSPSSTLAAETRDYMAAMAAKRRGDDAEALARLDAFLGRYPDSTLVHNARVERFRLLRALGRERDAADEARRYMAEHPDGFARSEARGIAVPSASAAPQRR